MSSKRFWMALSSLVIVFALATGGFMTTNADAGLEANKQLVNAFVEALNKRELAKLDTLLSKDFIEHNPFVPPDAPPGPATFVNSAGAILAAFPDAAITIEYMVAEGDLVATRHSIKATHKGTFNGVPATNKAVTWTENHLFRIKDGMIAEHWGELNAIGLLMQIGALPAPK